MSRIAFLGIMVLPTFFWHVSRNVAIRTPVLNIGVYKTAITIPENNQGLSSYFIAARDERIQDCLRLGNCKD